MEIDNKVFCALPFIYLYVDSLNEYKLCSDARLSSKINTNDMSILEYFNSDYMNEIRFDMLRGYLSEKIRGTCIRCIEREELGSWARRRKKIDKKIINNYKLGLKLIPTSDVIKLKFGNLCNLKCLTCGPYSSSRWAHERNSIQEMNVYTELKDEISNASYEKYGQLYQESFDYEFVQDESKLTYNFDSKFYDELKILLKQIKIIVISGGEPFLNDEFYDFIKWLIGNKYSHKLDIIVFSNMSRIPKNFKTFCDQFKSFTINVSIDGVNKKDEYIRRGTDFKEKDKNIKQLVEYFNVEFCATMSILNVGYQSELKTYCKQYNKRPSFFNILVEPFYLQINNLPHDIIEIYRQRDQHHELFDSDIKNIDHFKLGIKYLKKYDVIHKTNLLDQWPEFEKYYE
jgi:MoaA/NifB/PqqE/SkfB family radical SAM enzyme